MGKRSIATVLATELRRLELAGLLSDVHAVYFFGSARTDTRPRDVDLVVVWDASRITPLEALALRPMLIAALDDKLPAPLDVTLLSQQEAASSRFPESENAEIVYRR